MKEQKVIITDRESDINNYLENGWRVISVTPGHVSSNHTTYSKFAFVLEK